MQPSGLLLQSDNTQDTVICLRTCARVHFSAQIWQRLLVSAGGGTSEEHGAALRYDGSQFILFFTGTAVKDFHAAAAVRMASSLSEREREKKKRETEIIEKIPRRRHKH